MQSTFSEWGYNGRMTTGDRRKGGDRRLFNRVRSNVQVEWESSGGKSTGTLNDLSPTGCFILCSGDVIDGDQVRVDVPLSSGGTVSLWGEVANHAKEIGFGLRFIGLTQTQRIYIERLIETLRPD
jgi:hypothetical protein